MVVFHYGSVVLFNVNDHEVEGYLKIVLKHASGLLSEMRKDGEFISRLIYLPMLLLTLEINISFNLVFHDFIRQLQFFHQFYDHDIDLIEVKVIG